MTKVAVVPHIGQPETVSRTGEMVSSLRDRNVEVVAVHDAAGLLGVEPTSFGPDEGLDLVIAIGGDGTVLKAVRFGRGSGAPIGGINHGNLGYLADPLPTDPSSLLDGIAARDWFTSERMLLTASINGGDPIVGLNDVVIEKVKNQRTIRLAISIDGEAFINYPADGVVVATATGSTAYNLSAGGPLIDPALDMLVMTPVAPHFLFSRSMVFPPYRRIRFDVMEDRPAVGGVDGREIANLNPGEQVEVEGGGRVSIARFADRSFPTSVRQKFSLT